MNRMLSGLAASLAAVTWLTAAGPAEEAQSPQSPQAGAPAVAAPGTPGLPPPGLPATAPPAAAPNATNLPPNFMPEAGSPAAAAVEAATAPDVAGAAPFSGVGGTLASAGAGGLEMLGDASPLSVRVPVLSALRIRPPVPPPVPGPGVPPTPNPPGGGQVPSGSILIPSVRGFKLAENQSPMPQDRVYFSFNYYDDVNYAINQRMNSALSSFQVYRYFFGFEKTFLDGRASVQMRFPIDNLTARSNTPGLGGTSTAVGDLAAILKYALIYDPEAGNVLSAGLLVSAPTGPHNFAGFGNIRSAHSATIQPYVGFIYSMNRLYFQGFSAIDVPFSRTADVLIWYNDIGLGYFLYRAAEPDRFLTLIAPTFEVHNNTPLNHGNPFNFSDIYGTPQVTNLTFGVSFGLGKRGLFSVGYIDPVTGPRPFKGELLAMLNWRF